MMHGLRVAKAHLDLRRVDVYVNAGRVDFEEQDVRWMAIAVENVLVRLPDRMAKQFVANETPIYITILNVACAARRAWQADGSR